MALKKVEHSLKIEYIDSWRLPCAPLGASPCISKRLHYACRPVATLSYLAPFYYSFRSNPPAATKRVDLPPLSFVFSSRSTYRNRSIIFSLSLPSPLIVSPFPRQSRNLHLPPFLRIFLFSFASFLVFRLFFFSKLHETLMMLRY